MQFWGQEKLQTCTVIHQNILGRVHWFNKTGDVWGRAIPIEGRKKILKQGEKFEKSTLKNQNRAIGKVKMHT